MTQTLLDLPINEIPIGSIDFVEATVTDRNDNNLIMGVEIAITRAGDQDHTWRPAGWLGTAAATRTAKTTSAVDTSLLDDEAPTTAGTRYGVYVLLDNGEAQPILQVGWIILTD